MAGDGVRPQTASEKGQESAADADIATVSGILASVPEDDSCFSDIQTEEDTDTSVFRWAREGNVDAVEAYLGENIDVNIRSDSGDTLLMIAVRFGHDKLVRVLLEHGDIDVNARNHRGHSALCLAVLEHSITLVRDLLGAKANVNTTDCSGRSPLSHAAAENCPRIIELLVGNRYISIDLVDDQGRTPLSWASTRAAAEVLLDNQADFRSKDLKGRSALDWANRNQNFNLAALLASVGERSFKRRRTIDAG